MEATRFSAREIVEQLLAEGTVSIRIGLDALTYLKRLVSQQKYEQEKVLRESGLLSANEVQRIRYTFDKDTGVCRITLSNPVRFEVIDPAVTPAVERLKEEAQSVAAVPVIAVGSYKRCFDGVLCNTPELCDIRTVCTRNIPGL